MSIVTVWFRCRRRITAPSIVVALMLGVGSGASPIHAADAGAPAGRWNAEGHDPDGTAYAGTALLRDQGDSLLYEGDMDGEAYQGIGIWHPATGTLALEFVEQRTGRRGVAHFVLDEGRLDGQWVFSDQPGDHGVEVWTRADQ